MSARYLIRFDDICPTMNWDVWDRVEAILIKAQVQPILAVVPDNHDPNLEVMPPRSDFWERARRWQEMGWSIALHGYVHRYETRDSGLIGINSCSEFAGLPRDLQRNKLCKALDIFKEHGVRADAWVAPGHSFDETTVELLLELGLDVISDGYFWRPVTMAKWVPQQLWRFRTLPGGTWTVCYHTNHFSSADIDNLARSLVIYHDRMTSLDDVIAANRVVSASLTDKLFAWVWRVAVKIKLGLRGKFEER